MFSGIVEELGSVLRISRRGKVSLLEIRAQKIMDELVVGDSVAVNGACLTVVATEGGSVSFEVMPETLKLTNLGLLRSGEKVNLERSLRVGDRISGHFVSGHVDCMGIIRKKGYVGGNLSFEIAVPVDVSKYCLAKGSIAVDGISLTLTERKPNTFSVYIIPHTLKNTTLSFRTPSDKVNIEFDILAKSGRAR